LIGVALELAIPTSVGVALAVITRAPRLDAFQEHVAIKLLPEPAALLFLHPGITTPFNLNVTFAETLTSAVIRIAVL
jgi:hypothetical protein